MLDSRLGKTKIVCTLGPSTTSTEILTELIRGGMDVARLNLSHGTHEEHLFRIKNLREASGRMGEEVAILLDLQGPKIRIGELSAPFVDLKAGATLRITTEQVVGDGNRVSTTYARLAGDVRPGDDILLDDGKLRLRVLEIKGKEVVSEVVIGGRLSPKKGINLPGVLISAPSLTDKDLTDLEFGIKHDVDYVALSFVRAAEDIRELRKAVIARVPKGKFLSIIAKIEKPQAITNIDEIITESDGIMIARGDLGVELPPEDVPILQKMIIRKCNEAGKPVVIATQMLESMISSPTPTRAEASDVANAVVDGGDAVMLSGETSVGKYPLESVQMMDRIVRKVESENAGTKRVVERPMTAVAGRQDALGRAACVLAEQMNAAAIVTVTRTGNTAKTVARYRPQPKIVAVTDKINTLRQLQIVWGVHGLAIENLHDDSDKALSQIQEKLVQTGLVQRGEFVVLLAGQPFFARGSTNFIKVEKVE
jgi:pyruvate kinase